MALTPAEEKLRTLLSAKKDPTDEDRAMLDVLEEKSREVIIAVEAVNQSIVNARAFAERVAKGEIGDYVLLGMDRNGQPVITVTYRLHEPASYAMTALLKQVTALYESRLQRTLEAKMT